MISALVGHLVGDFLLQTSWMANKKKFDFMGSLETFRVRIKYG